MAVPIDELKNRLKKAMSIRDMKPIDLVEKTGISKSAISQYMSGYTKPKQDRIYLISKALNVSEAWLMGFNAPMERTVKDIDPLQFDNIKPISTQKIPLIGEIACGEPIVAIEDFESYIELGTDIKADCCLRCKGDSMVGARIYDGDIVFIRKQPTVNNGEIAAVIIGDDVTLKRVYFQNDNKTLVLKPENSKYPPLVYSGANLEQVRIFGKAVAFQSDVK